MNDKEYETQKGRIKKLTAKWVKAIGLGWYKINIEYIREEKQPENTDYSPKVIDGKWVTALDTSCDPYYLTAQIRCYLPILKDMDDEDLEEYFLHELMHIFLSPMHTKAKAKEEELVCTKLAQAFVWSQDIPKEKAKKRPIA
jgi:hypothetical protein